MTAWIAEQRVVFLHRDGTRSPGRIALGAPVVRGQDCACEVALDGFARPVRIYGDSTLQALLLGARFLARRLRDFTSKGGRVVFPAAGSGDSDEQRDVPLDALFGGLPRAP